MENTFVRGINWLSSIETGWGSDEELFLYQEHTNPQEEALRIHLFPFVKEEVIRMLNEFPTFYRNQSETLQQAMSAENYHDLPQLEGMPPSGLGWMEYENIDPCTWEFVRRTILMYIEKLDWTIVFPNDVVRIENKYFIKPRTRITKYGNTCTVGDTEIGSIWTNDEETFSHVDEERNFFVWSVETEPERGGIFHTYYETAEECDGNYYHYPVKLPIVFFTDFIEINVEKTISFLHDSFKKQTVNSNERPNQPFHSWWFGEKREKYFI